MQVEVLRFVEKDFRNRSENPLLTLKRKAENDITKFMQEKKIDLPPPQLNEYILCGAPQFQWILPNIPAGSFGIDGAWSLIVTILYQPINHDPDSGNTAASTNSPSTTNRGNMA